MSYDKAKLKESIKKMQDVYDAPSTSDSTKDAIRPSLEKAKKLLEELESKKEEPAKQPAPAEIRKIVSKGNKKIAKVKPVKKAKAIQKKLKSEKRQKAKKEKPVKLTTQQKKTLSEIVAATKKYAGYKGKSERELRLDSQHKAKKPGSRVSASGNTYREYRLNRADVDSDSPYLEKGGELYTPGKVDKKLKFPRTIKGEFDTYKLYLITSRYVFYIDSENGDSILMYNKKMKLLSDNVLGENELAEITSSGKGIVWGSSSFKYNQKAQAEEDEDTIAKGGTVVKGRGPKPVFLKAKGGNIKSQNALVVSCASVGNPDHGQYAALSPKVKVPINSLKEASEACRKYIEEYNLGGGNWSGGYVHDAKGKFVAYVGYSGRVWNVKPILNPKKTAKEIVGKELNQKWDNASQKADGGEIEDGQDIYVVSDGEISDHHAETFTEQEFIDHAAATGYYDAMDEGVSTLFDIDDAIKYTVLNLEQRVFKNGVEITDQYKDVEEDETIEPDHENDSFIVDQTRGGYDVSFAGKFLGNAGEMDEALQMLKDAQAKGNWFPNWWFVSDHGNMWLIDHEGNEIKMKEGGQLSSYMHTELGNIPVFGITAFPMKNAVTVYHAEKRGGKGTSSVFWIINKQDAERLKRIGGYRIQELMVKPGERPRSFYTDDGAKVESYNRGGELATGASQMAVFGYMTGNFTPAASKSFKAAVDALNQEDRQGAYYLKAKTVMRDFAKTVDELLSDRNKDATRTHELLQRVGAYNHQTGGLVSTIFLSKALAQRNLAKGGTVEEENEEGEDGYAVVFTDKGITYSVETDMPEQAELVFDALEDFMNKRITKKQLDLTLDSYEYEEIMEPTAAIVGNKYYSGFYEREIPIIYEVNIDKKTSKQSKAKGGKVSESYDVISPDGFSIHPSDTYSSKPAAEKALKEWMKRYERQGYYSSNRGRIQLSELADHCKIIPVEKAKKGKRLKSGLMRDRAYKSNQPHELAYHRRTRPVNPRYSYASGGMITWADGIVGKIFDAYLPGTQPNEVFAGVSGGRDKGDYAIDKDRAGDGANLVYIVISFADQYDDAVMQIDSDYDNWIKPAQAFADKQGYSASVYTNDEDKAVTFSFKNPRSSKYASGGRLKSGLMRDRKYNSDQPHELAYHRKTRPRNPRYKKEKAGKVNNRKNVNKAAKRIAAKVAKKK
jgi:hypothetical protein